jgi:hypothetical protein
LKFAGTGPPGERTRTLLKIRDLPARNSSSRGSASTLLGWFSKMLV